MGQFRRAPEGILEEVGDRIGDEGQTAVSEVTRLPRLISPEHCIVGVTGITLKDSCTYRDYARLIRYMDQLAYAHSVRDILFKFYIGDAFNGGERKFGEMYSQVMNRLHWSQGYISNIQWVARKIPPDLRDIKLSNWKFWSFIAPMEPEDQKRWISEALEEMKMGDSWFERLKERMESWLLRRELDLIEDDDFRQEVEELVADDNSLRWSHIKKFRRDKYAPRKAVKPAVWWAEAFEESDLDDQTQETVMILALSFVKDLQRRRVRL